MKLALSIFCGFAVLSFGQEQLLLTLPSGSPLSLRADSIANIKHNSERAKMLDHLADLLKRLTTVTAEYKPEHPDVKTLRVQMEKLEAQISAVPVLGIVHLKGNVELRTDTMVLTADEADYHAAKGEIEPRGNVRVRLMSK